MINTKPSAFLLLSILFFTLSLARAQSKQASGKLEITGTYNGYLVNEENEFTWPYTITIEPVKKFHGQKFQAAGMLEMGNDKVAYQLQVVEDFSGYNLKKIELFNVGTTTPGNWCRFYLRGDDIEIWDDSLIISGNWGPLGKAYLKDGVLFSDSTGLNCKRGYFRLAKAADNSNFAYATKRSSKGCINGDCINGQGEFLTYNGTYKGSFVNGIRQGQGAFEFTSGPRKGVAFTGSFANNNFNGYGKITYMPNMTGSLYYEGNFLNGYKSGEGSEYYKDGTIQRGIYSKGQPWGFGRKIRGAITTIGYYEFDGNSETKGLDLTTLKNHQDTVFAKFKKCNCLAPHNFAIPSFRWESVKYDYINTYTGEKEGTTTLPELSLDGLPVKGYINNTGRNIYIRGYLKVYFKDRKVYEYVDESFTVKPGEMIMGNYRKQPIPGDLYAIYFNQNFIYAGQYCEKTAVCK